MAHILRNVKATISMHILFWIGRLRTSDLVPFGEQSYQLRSSIQFGSALRFELTHHHRVPGFQYQGSALLSGEATI